MPLDEIETAERAEGSLLDLDAYRWALRTLVVLAVFAWGGFALAVVDARFEIRPPENLMLAFGFAGILIYCFCLFRLYRSLGRERALPRDLRRRLRAMIWLTGPGGAVETLLAIRRLAAKSREGLVR